eukprot:CAMPEP_0113491114 /NCGR_PEP_ID=MMETSP0014_2-20120614/27391_1 /TAXON_ID=2857 /ORGANISM="Nitzschia sp." /LENGTH=445 /DNA_ID=CAMNT_0000384899 /DNA_START=371 /DNA_END=1708 /DNA_ORIENTATION=+ /assembly_acc=CAM_ASM_000159
MSQGKFLAGLLTEMSIDPTNLSIDVVPDNAKSSFVVATTRSRPPSRQTSFTSSQSIQHQQNHHHTVAPPNSGGNCPSVSFTNCDDVDKNGSILPGSSSPSWSSSSASASSSSTPTMTLPTSSPPLQSLPSSVVAVTGEDPLVSQDAGKNVGGDGSSSSTFEYHHHRDVAAASPIMPISRLTLQNRKERKLRERWGNGESSSISSNSCSSHDGSATRRTSPAGKALPQMNRHLRKPTMWRSFSDITDWNFHPQARILQSRRSHSLNHSHDHITSTSTSTTTLPTSPSSMPLSQPRRKSSLTEEELQSMMLQLSSSATSTNMNMDESLDFFDIEHRAPSDEKGGSDDDFSHTAEEGEEQQHDQLQQLQRDPKETVTMKMMSRFSQSDSCLTSTTAMSMTPRMPVRKRSIEPKDDYFDTSFAGNDGSEGSIKPDIINRAIHELTTHDE